MPQALTRQASGRTATIVQLKVPRRYHVPAEEPRPTDEEMHSVGSGNFCRCWMPAWFRLAELVGEERRRSIVAS